ncbi:MAG: tetratricopeptide repeat protein [Acidobacteriota bacterium]|nr:tetratricopeptide repeat protein [Acidobacteriota bacterium]
MITAPSATSANGAARTAALAALLATSFNVHAAGPLESQTVEDPSPVVGVASPFERATTLQAHELRGFRASVANQLLSATELGEIAIAVLATPLDLAGDRVRVPFFVEIDGASFLEHNNAALPRVEIYAYALEEGAVASYSSGVFTVDLATLGEAVWASGLKFYGQLELDPGSYDLRVLVRNFQNGASGLRSVPVTVTQKDAGTPHPIVVFPTPKQRDSWVTVRQARGLDGSSRPYPLVSGDEAITPAARPVATSGRTIQAVLFDASGAAPLKSGRAQAMLLGETDRVAAEARFDLAPPRVTSDGTVRSQPFEFKFGELASGEYNLHFEFERPDGDPSRVTTQPIIVAEESTRERDLLWVDLRWLVRAQDKAAPIDVPLATTRARKEKPPSSRRNGSRIIARNAQAYKAALALLGHGEMPQARTALFDLESEAMAKVSTRGLERLRAAQLEVAEALVAKDSDSLLPVIEFHHSIYLGYRSRRLFSLATHARRLVEDLSDIYVVKGGAPTNAANAFVSLAGYLQEAQLLSSSERLFLRALERDPSNVTALLGLAANFEKGGHYNDAIGYLERLIEVDPDSSEGLLRLAVNLQRVGTLPRAQQLFSDVLEGSGPAWVRCLAAEELGRAYLRAGDLTRAVEVLERALPIAPREHSPYVLLAYLYDRLHQPAKALEMVSTPIPRPDDRASARQVYDSWPFASMKTSREALSKLAAAGLPALSRLLDGAA